MSEVGSAIAGGFVFFMNLSASSCSFNTRVLFQLDCRRAHLVSVCRPRSPEAAHEKRTKTPDNFQRDR
jgi:hypothetical protein